VVVVVVHKQSALDLSVVVIYALETWLVMI